jgi:multiple sugar transport system permease protein
MAVYPTFRVLYLSLTDTSRLTGDLSFVGFRNYLELFRDPIFRKVVGHTLSFSLSSSLGHIVLGLLLALAMNARLNRRFVNLCRAVILLPWAVSPIVVAMIAQLWAYPLTSPIAMTLQALGWAGEFSPLGRPATAMWSLIVINVWQFTPFFMLMILAGLQTMNPELHEAAQVDGASPLQRLRYLTLPHIRDILLTLSLFDLVTTAAYFDLIWVTTQGGPVRSTEVLATFTYRIGFLSMDWHRAATVGVILLVVCVLLAAGVVAIMERGRE